MSANSAADIQDPQPPPPATTRTATIPSPYDASSEGPALDVFNDSALLEVLVNHTWAWEMGVPLPWLAHHASTPIPVELHLVVAIMLTIIGVMGTAGNAVVVCIFTSLTLHSPPSSPSHGMPSLLALKLVVSGCNIYGGGVGIFGLVSIVTLSWIAVERLTVIRTSAASKWRITRATAMKLIVAIWVYCAALALPPFFGWSAYVPEGLLTSCSWDYISRSSSNRSYYVYLLVGGFAVPVVTIIYCYCYILVALSHHSRHLLPQASPRSPSTRCNDLRTAQMVLTLIMLFAISWSPYATVSLIGQFGEVRVLTPWVTSLPALFAKASVIYNPIVYGMSHPNFRASLQYLFSNIASTQQQMHYKPSNAARHVSVNSVLALQDDSTHRHWHSEDFYTAANRNYSIAIMSDKDESCDCLLAPDVTAIANGDSANLSEPDLLRHDDRIIPAHFITYLTYHREKRRFLRSALFCSESSLERYDRRSEAQRCPRQKYLGGGGGLMPTTTPNCVLKQTGPETWDHVALLAPSLPLHNVSNMSLGSASPDLRRTSFSTICSRSPRLSLNKLSVST
nr:rhodopsin-like [Cherax quadricarinatus]